MMKSKFGWLLMLATHAFAATFSGTVRDPQGGPVAGATVTLYSAAGVAASATTDAGGAYRIEDLPGGDYLVRATASSFAAYVGERVPQEAAIVLQIAGVHEQVVVTAAGASQAPEQVSRSIDVIDASDAADRNSSSLCGCDRSHCRPAHPATRWTGRLHHDSDSRAAL